MPNNYTLSMAQIKADLFMADAAITEAKKHSPKAAKYIFTLQFLSAFR